MREQRDGHMRCRERVGRQARAAHAGELRAHDLAPEWHAKAREAATMPAAREQVES